MKILNTIILILSIATCYSQSQLPYLNWEKTYGGSNTDIMRSIQPTADGGYLLGGTSGSNDGDIKSGRWGEFDFWVVKIDSVGIIEWEKSYGGSSSEFIRFIQPTADGGYLLSGNSNSNDGNVQSGNNGSDDYWVVKIDKEGIIEWEQSYGGSEEDNLQSIQPSIDGGYLLGGYSSSNDGDVQSGNLGDLDFWIVKINDTGALEWEKSYGSSGREFLIYHQPTPDGGYLLGGVKYFYPPGVVAHSDFWIIKIDNTGNIEWEQTYGGSRNESMKYIHPLANGGYLLGGITSSNDGDVQSGNNGSYPTLDYWIVKIDSIGTLEWEQTYGGSDFDVLWSIQPVADEGFILGGTTGSNDGDIEAGNKGLFDFWILKIDNLGEVQWEKTYGGSNNEVIRFIYTASPDEFLVGGSTSSNNGDVQSGNKGVNDFWLVDLIINTVPVIDNQTFTVSDSIRLGPSSIIIESTDDDGDSLRFNIVSGNEHGNFFIQNNGSLNVLRKLNIQAQTLYALEVEVSDGKHASNAVITLNIERIIGQENLNELIKIFPNPISDATLNINISSLENLSLEIIDLKGAVILSEGLIIGSNNIEWQGINRGIYILRIIAESEIIYHQRIIKN